MLDEIRRMRCNDPPPGKLADMGHSVRAAWGCKYVSGPSKVTNQASKHGRATSSPRETVSTMLADIPARAVPVTGRGTRPAERAPQALRPGAETRARRGLVAGSVCGWSGAAVTEPGHAVARLLGQGRVRRARHTCAGGATGQRTATTAPPTVYETIANSFCAPAIELGKKKLP